MKDENHERCEKYESCYKKMYLSLMNEITDTIERLKELQQKAEECYISFDDNDCELWVVTKKQ